MAAVNRRDRSGCKNAARRKIMGRIIFKTAGSADRGTRKMHGQVEGGVRQVGTPIECLWQIEKPDAARL
jgi:hypothetical protein